MLDHEIESGGWSLDSIDMRPIDLSTLGHPPIARFTEQLTAGSSVLPSLNLDNLSGRALPGAFGAGAIETVAGASGQRKDAVQPDGLPALSLTLAEANACRNQEQGLESKAVKSTLGKFDGRVPGVMVRIPPDYDPCKPISLLVYNHGFGSTAKSAIRESDLDAQMKNAAPNTVFIVPEWQASPGSRSGAQGAFKGHSYFDHKIDEVFAKIPALQGRSVNDVANINIVAHSAGYGPTESEIYHNKLAAKVKSITLLDALYDNHGFDQWLKDNIKSLAEGSKQFTNIYHGTHENSIEQAQRVKTMLRQAGLSQSNFYFENDNGKHILSGDELAKHSIVFKYSSATVGSKDPHSSLPSIYIAKVNESSSYNI